MSSIVDNLRASLASFKTADLLVAVVFAVVARIYLLVGSPLANAWLQSMGPVGQFLATFAIGIVYFILLLAAVIRGNMLVTWVAGVLMAIIRVLTGDPFGPVALQAYAFGGFTGWVAFAAMGNRHTYLSWMVTAWWFSMGLDFVFYTFYLPVAPLLGSTVIGWFVVVVLYRMLLGVILGALVKPAGDALQRSEALRGIVRRPPSAPNVSRAV
jgi:ABC-type thiamin/hydroxymethylpyrimidine transport system permease subunit